jgi:tetrapyrrole methylase family protein/MazG family protein
VSLIALIEPALTLLGATPPEIQIVDALALLGRHYPNISVDRPALIGPLATPQQCEQIGVLLQLAYPTAHQVTLLSDIAGSAPQVRPLPLHRLGEALVCDGPTVLYLPALPGVRAVETFQDTVAHLRAPDGCPWDREQTHRSLRQGFQEESYEVLDALDRGDVEALEEELGDILLHVLLQAQIASELGEFQLSDLVHHVNAKIVHRHPHVFGGLEVDGVDQVLVNWELLKRQEKGAAERAPSALDSVSPAMPALARAQSLQRHASRSTGGADRVRALCAEVSASLAQLCADADAPMLERRIGDLLFDLADLARVLHLDAESALREANARFEEGHRARENRRAISRHGGTESAEEG